MAKEKITVEVDISAPVEKVWKYYNTPEHIKRWNNASDDWHTPKATNDLRADGKFNFRMESKDGKEGFDFEGTYTNVKEHEYIEYTFGDRTAKVTFVSDEDKTHISVEFDPEDENPVEMQKAGWQSILDNFKKYTESN